MDVNNIPTHRVESALNQAQELAAEVRQLVGRLIGYQPVPDEAEGSLIPDCGGVLGQLEGHAGRAIADITKAKDEINRLRSVLPVEATLAAAGSTGDEYADARRASGTVRGL